MITSAYSMPAASLRRRRHVGEQRAAARRRCGDDDGVEPFVVDAPSRRLGGRDRRRRAAGADRAASVRRAWAAAAAASAPIPAARGAEDRTRWQRVAAAGPRAPPSSRLRCRRRAGELRHRCEARPVGVGRVDAADERIDEPFVDLVAEPLPHEAAERVVGVATGQQRLDRGAEPCPRQLTQRRSSRTAGSQRACRARCRRGSGAARRATPRPSRRWATSMSVMPDRGGQLDGVGHAGQVGVGALVDVIEPGERAMTAILPPTIWRRPPTARRARVRLVESTPDTRPQRTRPAMPPPTTRTLDGHPSASRPRWIRWASAAMTVGVVVDARGAIELEPGRIRTCLRLDVEVVEDLEMVGDETDRRDDDAVDVARSVAEFVDHLEDVGADPGLGGASGALPGDLPVGALDESRGGRRRPSAVERSSLDVRSPVARMRSGREWAVNSTRVRSGMSSSRARRSVGDEIDEGGLGRP